MFLATPQGYTVFSREGLLLYFRSTFLFYCTRTISFVQKPPSILTHRPPPLVYRPSYPYTNKEPLRHPSIFLLFFCERVEISQMHKKANVFLLWVGKKKFRQTYQKTLFLFFPSSIGSFAMHWICSSFLRLLLIVPLCVQHTNSELCTAVLSGGAGLRAFPLRSVHLLSFRSRSIVQQRSTLLVSVVGVCVWYLFAPVPV